MSSYGFQHRGMCAPIEEPKPWPFDGLTKRVPVIDPNDNRVIRQCGYRKCMCCQKHFWSGDVARVRMCEKCKE